MLQLHGFPLSNYFNMVKAALLEKGIPFEFVAVRPSQEGDYLAKSPMGKVPCIRTEEGWLSETQVILEYLEERQPQPALLPKDRFARAKVRELARSLELYIELPARTCYAPVFFGGVATDETQEKAKQTLQRGVRALAQIASFSPFIAGPELTYADLFAVYTLPIADRVTQKLWQWALLGELKGAPEWFKRMNERESMKQIRADQKS